MERNFGRIQRQGCGIMKRKFFYKIFIFIFLGSLFSIIFLTSVIYFKTREENYKTVYQQAEATQREFGQLLNDLLSEYKIAGEIWAQDSNILSYIQDEESGSSDEIYNLIYASLAQKDFRAEITILDENHHVSVSTNKELAQQYNLTSDDWGIFREIKNQPSGDAVVYIPQTTPNSSVSLALSLGIPVYESDNLVGYIMIDFPHTTFSTIYRSSIVPYNIDLVLTDAHLFSFYDSRNISQKNVFLPEVMQSGFQTVATNKKEKQTETAFYLSQMLPNFDLKVFAIIPFERFDNLSKELAQSLGLIVLLLLLASGIFSLFLAYSLYRPIDAIIKRMTQVEKGNLDVVFEVSDNSEMAAIANRFNSMMKTIRYLMQANESKQQALRAAEIKALQSQMRPHFLYNVLNTIKFMAKLNGVESIADMVTQLGTLLRSNIATEKETESVAESIRLIESYLKIQSYRYEDTLDYHIYVDPEAEACIIPRLLIQPLVENAIIHGIEEINEKGFVYISIIRNEDKLFIIVEDNGKGIATDIIQSVFSNKAVIKSSHGSGIGLRNIYLRLGHYYGKRFRMKIISTNGTSIFIEIPYSKVDQ